MAYYDYYRRHNPSMWGRPEYAMDSPPAPRYQPQPQWRGVDYYRAHADGGDPSAFDYVWGRVKSHFRPSIGRREAESWHRRVYGGQVDVSTMMPSEIGAAAGYEAWRFWEHHRGIYRQPLMDDHERESEALVGLAVGEAEKLWDYTRRRGDRYGKREALETAAGVAMKLFRKGGGGGGGYSGGVRYEEPYLAGDSRYPRHHRHRRSSSVSPPGFDDDYRRGFSGSDSDYERDREYSEYGRSPALTSSYRLGSPSVASAVLPGGGGYSRRRASSTYYDNRLPTGTSPYIPPLDSALSTSPSGALIIPPPTGHHHSSSFGGYGSSYDYRDPSGRVVHRATHGDPSSEYGHLPPGTYMVQGGSGRRKHRKSHSGGVRYVM